MILLAKRNLKLYFRDKSGVFFSLLAVLIVIGLYACFLGDVWLKDVQGIAGARALMSAWLSAGILTVASFTTTLGAFSAMVEDRTQKITKDFYASPLPRSAITGGYLISAWVIGMVMCLIALVFLQAYMLWQGAPWLTPAILGKVILLLALSTGVNTSILCVLVSVLKSGSAYSAASTVVGTLMGFLTGIYLPVGSLPEGVQWVIKCFPPSHVGALLRQSIMEPVIKESFAGAPAGVEEVFSQLMGIRFYFGTHQVSWWQSLLLLLATGLVFSLLAARRMNRRAQ